MSLLPMPSSALRPTTHLSRDIGIFCALILASCALAIYALAMGSMALTTQQVIEALAGKGPNNLIVIVTQWRLPRVAMALLLGAALGVSGAIFQSLLRNPLGSPDVIGFNSGAYSGVLIAIVFFGANSTGITFAALISGLLSALLIYLLTWQQGINTLRLIIIGIAVRALLFALNTWLITSASLESALSAGLWNAGSLNGITWAKSFPVIAAIVITLLLLLPCIRAMILLEMGDDSASSLGVSPERSRFTLLILGVLLTASATALAGPISFIALAAPQIARRLCANRHLILLTALTGALLLLAADVGAQRLFLPYQLPVGVLTVSVGGIYLIWLLIRESRKS